MHEPADPLSADPFVEQLVHEHGEQYRQVIHEAIERAQQIPRFNPATFNFARYVAAHIFLHSVGPPHS